MNRSAIISALVVWHFAIAFVLAGSGWGHLIARAFDDRPWWSVCDEAMCACPPVQAEPDCPLCESGRMGERGCAAAEKVSRAAVVFGDKTLGEFFAITHAGESALVGMFLLGGSSVASVPMNDPVALASADAMSVPVSAVVDVPSPPPRA